MYLKTDWMVKEAEERGEENIIAKLIQKSRADGKTEQEIVSYLATMLDMDEDLARAYLAKV
jgi:hypothetical protein